MAHVRVAHRGVPVRPVLPNPRVVPVRPGLPNPRCAPVRPFVIQHHTIPRIPTHHRPPPVAVKRSPPQYLPVLQPPILPGSENYDDNEEEHYQEEIFHSPTVGIIDQHKITTQQLTHRIPTLMSSRNHPRQLTTRRFKPNYPPYYKYNR